MKYRIYPPIGIARVGNSNEFFIGPESVGAPGIEIGPDGAETPVTDYKDAAKDTKKQGARFRVLVFDDAGKEVGPLVLPAGAWIEWSVHVVNMKDAVERGNKPPPPPAAGARLRPRIEAGMQDRVIDARRQTIRSDSTAPVDLQGSYRGRDVVLGRLMVDRSGNLVVLGGNGRAEEVGGEPHGTGGFFDNRGWFDDIADGPVSARIGFPDGIVADARPAWVMSAPPDFAPFVGSPITLYDLIRDVALKSGLLALAAQPDFSTEIQPLLRRVNAHQWVTDEPLWASIEIAGTALETPDKSAAAVAKRTQMRDRVLKIEQALSHSDRADTRYHLREWQKDYLQMWVEGDFTNGGAAPAGLTANNLARAALDAAVGQTLFPGIEAGVILQDPSVYLSPFEFRLDPAQLNPGELTALMALPWQADFKACDTNWWPAQRPNVVQLADSTRGDWDRGAGAGIASFVQRVMKFGVIVPATDAQGNPIQRESGRA